MESLILTTELIALIVMSIYLLVNHYKFKPSQAQTKLELVTSWACRIGTSIVSVSSFKYLLDIWTNTPYNPTLVWFAGGVCLIFARIMYKSVSKHPLSIFDTMNSEIPLDE